MSLALLLSLLPVTALPAFAEGESYRVAGVAELCGSLWDANDDNNLMTHNVDTGLYEKTYTDVQPGEYPIKVVETCSDGTTNWYGDAQDGALVIYVSAVCDVTVTFDAGTHAIGILGDSAVEKTWMDIEAVRVVGNGDGVWLNGVSWNPAADENKMTEVSSGVYEITYAQVPAGSGYQFKFSANGSWTDNWGAGSVEGEAVFDSDTSISLALTETTDVTLRLDLTGFVYATKLGATYAVVLGSGDDTEKVEADYLDAEGNLQTCAAASVLTADSTAWEAGWYVAQGEVTIPEAVTLNGDVHLILADNCGLTVESGIAGSGNLTVYAQSTGDQMGSLTATGTAVSEKDAVSAGIFAESITINGGVINATGGTGEGSDITSAGLYSTPGDITINGGSVTATGGSVTGACSNSLGIATEEADITVNGGTVNATGAPSATWSIGIYAYWGAFLLSDGSVTATGMDAYYDGGRTSAWSIGLCSDEFTVSGGELTATAGTAAGNMPESYGISCAFAQIDGGTVIAEAGAVDGGESIGISNYGTFTVTGGQVIATSGAATYSLGIQSIGEEQRFSVSGDAAVEATSGESTNLSAGIYAYSWEGGGTVSISGHASLLAIGKHSDDTSYGIYAEFPYADEASKVPAVQVTGGDLNVICFGGNELSYGVYAATILGDEAPQMTGELYISDGHVRVHNTDEGGQNHSALSAQPDLSGYGGYMWRTGMEDGFTPSTTPYEYSPTHSFVEFGGVASYGVSVNGVDVNEVNYADVLSDGVNDGKVSYDPATNTLTVTGALKDAEGNSILLEIAGNDTTDVVLSNDTDSPVSAGLTAFAVKDVTLTTNSGNPAFTGAVDITCSGNVALANSGTGLTVAGSLTVNGANNVTVTAAGSGQVIMGTTVISCSGDVSIVNSGTGMAVTAPLTVTGAKDVTVTANGGPTIAAAANIDCSGNVTIANSGGNITVAGTLTVTAAQDVTVTANAKNPAIASAANINCSGNVKIVNEGAGNAVSGKLTVTAAQDVTVSAKYYGPTVPSAVEITCSGNVTLTNESTGMFTGSTLTVHEAKNVTVTTNSGSPAISGEYGADYAAKINCSGNVKITNNGGMALGGTLIVTGAQDVTVTANVNNPAIAGVTDITCSGNVTLTNEGTGMVVPGPLTVTGAQDVTVTANSGSPACGSPTNINCSGNVKITNNGGMAFGSTLTVTGAKDVTVTANTTNPAISSTTTITCSGEVEIVNLGGGRALVSTLEIRKTDAHGYAVKTGTDPDNLTVYAEKAAGETFGPETLSASVVKTSTTHSLTKIEAKDPTCTEDGNSEYWTCSVCGRYFSDENGTTEIEKDSWLISATNHSLTKTEAKEPTCTEAGNSEYWICSVCGKFFSDEEGKNEIAKDSWLISATNHSLTKTEAKAPTCTEAGNSEYWTCSVCGKLFSDENGTTEIEKDSWVISATGHSLTKTEAKAPTCTEGGNSAYWTCSACGKYFSDENGTTEIEKNSWLISATGHTEVIDAAVSATCTEAGKTEGKHCSVCGEVLAAQQEIPALGHDWNEGTVTTLPTETTEGVKTFTCKRCGVTKTESIPATGEQNNDPCDGGENCPSGKFVDVNPKEWYHLSVDYVVTHGLFGGTSENTFEPETAMTRAMLVTVLWRYEGQPEAGENTFSDVPSGKWYTNAVAWAAENGIVGGVGNNRFDPDGEITREQMATILFRYAEKKGIETGKRGSLNIFSDEKQLSAYAKDAVQWAVAEQIINGSDGKLLPQGSATRAQVATILMRFIENIVK